MFVVTTPATDRSLLTIPELRAAVGIGDGSKDAELTTLGNRLSAAITAACRIASAGTAPPTLRRETLTETFRLRDRDDRRQLRLARRPIANVASIVENADDPLTAADYQIEASAGLLTRISGDSEVCWPSGKIVAVYDAGWESVPEDLKLAAAKLAKSLWADDQTADASLKVVDIPGVIRTERWVAPSSDPLLPAEVMDILAAGGYAQPVIV